MSKSFLHLSVCSPFFFALLHHPPVATAPPVTETVNHITPRPFLAFHHQNTAQRYTHRDTAIRLSMIDTIL